MYSRAELSTVFPLMEAFCVLSVITCPRRGQAPEMAMVDSLGSVLQDFYQ